MQTFKEIRQIIIDLCKFKNACGSENTPHNKEFGKLVNAKTEKEFWEVIVTNGNWCYDNEILKTENFEKYGQDKMAKFGIFWEGKHKVINKKCYAWDSSTVVAMGSSTVEAMGSSTVVARGSSTVVAWGSSSVKKAN